MPPESPWRSFGPGAATLEEGAAFGEAGPRTTLRLAAGGAVHGEAHLRRLMEGCAVMGRDASWLEAAFTEALSGGSEALVRMQVDPLWSVLRVRREPLNPLADPYRLLPRRHPLGDPRGDPRAPHKGLMGPWSAGALQEAQNAGAADLLCLWPDGTLAETALAAVAVRVGGSCLVPPREGRVASLAEALDLPGWAAARGLRLRTVPIPFEDCFQGTLLCFNAARGVWQAEILPSEP